MKNYIGSVVRKSNFFHWRYRDVNGKSTSKVIKNANGVKVTDLAEAEAVAAQWSEEPSSCRRFGKRFNLRTTTDTKANAVKNLPVLGEMPSQGSSFETVISSLPASQISRVAACLESLLTPKQKDELLRQLR